MNNLIVSAHKAYAAFVSTMNHLQSPLLLAIRLYWGWQFAQDGWGKLTHLDKVTEFFTSLNLPAPHTTALMIALVEFCGGILLSLGLASRLTSLVLFVNMTMAYLTVPDDRVNFSHIFSKPEDFYGASPYTYWFAALLILILGPGRFAIDTLLRRHFSIEREPAHIPA
jgi:putative oxidoreductase